MVVMDLDEEVIREWESIEEVVNVEEFIDDEVIDIYEEEVSDVKDDLVSEIIIIIEFFD